jgi:hypothetical protein
MDHAELQHIAPAHRDRLPYRDGKERRPSGSDADGGGSRTMLGSRRLSRCGCRWDVPAALRCGCRDWKRRQASDRAHAVLVLGAPAAALGISSSRRFGRRRTPSRQLIGNRHLRCAPLYLSPCCGDQVLKHGPDAMVARTGRVWLGLRRHALECSAPRRKKVRTVACPEPRARSAPRFRRALDAAIGGDGISVPSRFRGSVPMRHCMTANSDIPGGT